MIYMHHTVASLYICGVTHSTTIVLSYAPGIYAVYTPHIASCALAWTIRLCM